MGTDGAVNILYSKVLDKAEHPEEIGMNFRMIIAGSLPILTGGGIGICGRSD
jgi:hypothetical protein